MKEGLTNMDRACTFFLLLTGPASSGAHGLLLSLRTAPRSPIRLTQLNQGQSFGVTGQFALSNGSHL